MDERTQEVLMVLRRLSVDGTPVGPTAIGLEMGYDYSHSSSKVSPLLKQLVEMGLATRTTKPFGRYVPTAASGQET